MSIELEIEGETEAVAAAAKIYHEAEERRAALPEEFKGSQLTPEHEALSDEDKKPLWAAINGRVDALCAEGEDFFVARLLAQEVPPTEDYIAAHRAVLAASEARHEAQLSYFRLNIWGMGECRETMWALGMAKDTNPGGHYEWPVPWDDKKAWALRDVLEDEPLADSTRIRELLVEHLDYVEAYDLKAEDFTDADFVAYRAFQVAQEAYRGQNDESTDGIELIKFGSNDGWLVTPQECASAVKVWKGTNPELQEQVRAKHSWWDGWITFLENGSTHGGFRVF